MECGNHRKSDVVVTMIKNHTEYNSVVIHSKNADLFGQTIQEVVNDFISENGLKGMDITIEDYGAWDYALLARLEACLIELEGDNHDN